jgi:selT/selW/selH-like putative selenoprotein
MKANFLRLRELLEQEFPGQWNNIQGANYPAPEWTSYASTVMSVVQMFAMVLILVGDNIWTYVPGFRRPPEFYYKMKENPALTFILMFLVIPSYVQSFANSGAFEVYVDQKLIYSKLETGRMPHVEEIIRALESIQMKRGA